MIFNKIKNIPTSSLLKGGLFILIFSFTASSFAFSFGGFGPISLPRSADDCPTNKPYFYSVTGSTYGYCSSVLVFPSCDTTDKGPRRGSSRGNLRGHHDRINSCLPGASGTKCYRTVDLTGRYQDGYANERARDAGKCLLPSTSRQEKCDAICGSGKACSTPIHKTGTITIGGRRDNSHIRNLPYEKLTCITCPRGQEAIGGTCRDNCTGGKVRSGTSCACRTGQEYVSGQCRDNCTGRQERVGTTCLSICTGGKVRDGTRDACQCPPEQEIVDGYGCRPSCESGQRRSGLSCLTKSTTPPTTPISVEALSKSSPRYGCMGTELLPKNGNRRDRRFLSKTCKGMGYPEATCYRVQSASSSTTEEGVKTKEGFCL